MCKEFIKEMLLERASKREEEVGQKRGKSQLQPSLTKRLISSTLDFSTPKQQAGLCQCPHSWWKDNSEEVDWQAFKSLRREAEAILEIG